jgi:carbamoyltransferase
MKITWGISANSHDAALAVFDDNNVVFASHSERFSGIKNDAHLNKELIEYALQWGVPSEVIWYEKSFQKSLRQLFAGQGFRFTENNVRVYLHSYGITAPVKFVSHHHSHAAAGFYTSNFDDATVVCLDSIGEYETFTIWEGKGTNLTKVFSQEYPHSVGLWYSAMTQRVGLKPNEDEYILMGMAAYGDPDRLFLDVLTDFIGVTGCGCYPDTRIKHNLHKGCMWWRPDLTSEQDMFDIAAATQQVYVYILQNIITWCKRYLPSENIVLMGGCALNCSANSALFNTYKHAWIMPNPGDAGSAIGAVLAYTHQHVEFVSPYLGYNIDTPYPVAALIQTLSTEGIAGVANGPAEFGPRSLGNRSLLADPRGSDIRDRVNDIKKRQRFRPFAPMILEEHASDYFVGPTGPYMQYTAVCKYPEQFPAIVHADGTSRVQTVGPNDNPGVRLLLEEWYKLTGCPMLLNTSLNIKGKPMVNTTTDAQEFAMHYGITVH